MISYFEFCLALEFLVISEQIGQIPKIQKDDLENFYPIFFTNYVPYSPECSTTGMRQSSICKLKWDLLRTSVTACTINKNTFYAPSGIFFVKTEI